MGDMQQAAGKFPHSSDHAVKSSTTTRVAENSHTDSSNVLTVMS